MKSTLLKINFCFPDLPSNTNDKRLFAKTILELMQENGSIEYAGYLKDSDLYNDLLLRIGDVRNYSPLNERQKQKIIRTIGVTISNCYKILHHPLRPIHFFIFPWFPSSEDRQLFNGVDALAPHESSVHLFIDTSKFTKKSIIETVAHEYNHLIYYHYHPTNKYALADHIAMEGFAEIFRKELFGGKVAPWSNTLTKDEAIRVLRSLKPLMNSKSDQLHKEVLFGSHKYKRWTGYSIGYQLVSMFKKQHPKYSWTELMRVDAAELLERFVK